MDCKPFYGVFAKRDNIVESKFLEDDEHGNYVIVDDPDVVKCMSSCLYLFISCFHCIYNS